MPHTQFVTQRVEILQRRGGVANISQDATVTPVTSDMRHDVITTVT